MAAVFFHREFEEPYGFLSQWYKCSFAHEGVTYVTAEMWMMVQKAKLFGDDATANEMLKTIVPKEHQDLGRRVKGFSRQTWDENKVRIVEEGNWLKFTKNASLKQKLLDTGDRELVEASPSDLIWGVGFNAAFAEENRQDWGQNLLGKAITAVRDRIRRES